MVANEFLQSLSFLNCINFNIDLQLNVNKKVKNKYFAFQSFNQVFLMQMLSYFILFLKKKLIKMRIPYLKITWRTTGERKLNVEW